MQMRARHTRRPGQGAGSRGTRGRNRLLKASAGGGAGRSPHHVGLPTHGHGSPDTTEHHRCYHRCCCAASEEVTLTAKRHTQTAGATLTPICPRTWRTKPTQKPPVSGARATLEGRLGGSVASQWSQALWLCSWTRCSHRWPVLSCGSLWAPLGHLATTHLDSHPEPRPIYQGSGNTLGTRGIRPGFRVGGGKAGLQQQERSLRKAGGTTL